ncbi:MAG: hypothetical protein U5R31_03920 [Acidimicrobiia bacterium]|nr:hypothetical protein [Acidimicrobiia bacterium]
MPTGRPEALELLATWLRDCGAPWLLVVDDADLVADEGGRLAALARDPDAAGCLVAAVRSDRWRNGFGRWTREAAVSGTGLVLGAPRPANLPWDLRLDEGTLEGRRPGRGLLVDGNGQRRVQVAAS